MLGLAIVNIVFSGIATFLSPKPACCEFETVCHVCSPLDDSQHPAEITGSPMRRLSMMWRTLGSDGDEGGPKVMA